MSDNTFLDKLEQFLNHRVAPKAQALEESDKLPKEILTGLGELKAYGVSVPEEYGGLAQPLSTLRDMLFLVGKLSPSLGLLMSVPMLTTLLVARFGSEEQRRSLLPRLCLGKVFGAFAVAEVGDWSERPSTYAVSRGEGYLLSGEKIMVSWGGESDYYFITARIEIDKDTNRPVVFMVPKGQPGLTFSKVNEKMAFPAYVNRNISLDKVRCSPQDMLGRTGFGLKIANDGAQISRLMSSTIALALAEACLEDAMATVTRVRPNGKRLADLEAVQFQLAEMKIDLETGRTLLNDTWDKFAENETQATLNVSALKVQAARIVMRMADLSLQLHGGWGYIKPLLAEQRFRQARIFSLIDGPTETQLATVANRLLAVTTTA